MILKLLIFAIIGFVIYRFLGGKFPNIGKNSKQKKLDEDTLVECAECKTYVTLKESLIVNGKYYCSDECVSKR